jgi:hypothetical protein
VTPEPDKLHPAEHRAYRELFAACRQLIRHWRRLIPSLEGTAAGEALERGVAQTERLLDELGPRMAAYGLYGTPMAQNAGAWIAELRTAVTDRAADTGLAVRSAVLDIEYLTTLLSHLAELARTRGDRDLAGFCEEWATRMESELGAVREAAAELGSDPERAAAPLDNSPLSRAAHGLGWVFGAFGEAVDGVVGRRRS